MDRITVIPDLLSPSLQMGDSAERKRKERSYSAGHRKCQEHNRKGDSRSSLPFCLNHMLPTTESIVVKTEAKLAVWYTYRLTNRWPNAQPVALMLHELQTCKIVILSSR